MSERDKKLEQMGYPLDRIAKPAAIYQPVVMDGSVVYASGAVPLDGDRLVSKGKVPSQVSLNEAREAAALCGANLLRAVRQELGSLDRIERVLRVTGYVNSDSDFTDQHLVVNGVSQLLIDGLDATFSPGASATIRLTDVKGALIRGCRPKARTGTFLKLQGPHTNEIVIPEARSVTSVATTGAPNAAVAKPRAACWHG